jgi:cell division protein FtsQ
MLMGLSAGVDYATTAPDFAVNSLVFESTEHVNSEDVRRILEIKPSTNILSLDLVALANKVAAEPWVARASISRQLPDTLTVQVEEHTPKAVILDGSFFLVDEDGEPFKRLEAGERGALPIISGIDLGASGAELTEQQARIKLALGALDQWSSKTRPKLSEINVGRYRDLTLYTAETGTQLRFGRGEFAARLDHYDGVRVALGAHAERLAVVHLDHWIDEKRGAKVVTRFVRDEDGDRLLAHASESRKSSPNNEVISNGSDRIEAQGTRARRIPRAH